MKLSIVNLLGLLFIGLTISSCASFSKSEIRRELVQIEKENLSQLDGLYTLDFTKAYQIGSASNVQELLPVSEWQTNAYDFSLNNSDDTRLLFNPEVSSEVTYQLSLKLENDTELRVGVLEDSEEIASTVLKGKYKGGMFYLDDNFQDCEGIPYLFGGCYTNNRRIGLTQSGNLLINRAIKDTGAVLFLMRSGYKYNVSYEYDRVSSKS